MDPQNGFDRDLRVFFVVNRLFEWSQNFVTRELTEIRDLGVQMTIGARDLLERDDLSPREDDLRKHYLNIRENPIAPDYLLRYLRLLVTRPRACIRAWGALLSLRHRPSKLVRAMVCLFRAAGLVDEVERRRVNLIHAYFLTAAGETAMYLSILTGIPFGASAYAMDIFVDNSGLRGKLLRAAYVNATTRYNERVLRELVPERSERIVTRYYGVYPSDSVPETSSSETVTFLTAGRLVPKKGFRYLIEACGILRGEGTDFRCEIIGKGPLEEELLLQISDLGLQDHVVITGYVPPNEMPDRYRRCDVFVAPCVVADDGDRDGIPNVCLEAMSVGVPVISTSISGIPECVSPGRNGWLVPPEDSRSLADAMREAITTRDLPEMGRAALEMVRDRFDIRKNARPIAELLASHRLREPR